MGDINPHRCLITSILSVIDTLFNIYLVRNRFVASVSGSCCTISQTIVQKWESAGEEKSNDLIVPGWKMPGMSSGEVAFEDLLVGYNVTLILKRNIFFRHVFGIPI